jgi:hypothetical protein
MPGVGTGVAQLAARTLGRSVMATACTDVDRLLGGVFDAAPVPTGSVVMLAQRRRSQRSARYRGTLCSWPLRWAPSQNTSVPSAMSTVMGVRSSGRRRRRVGIMVCYFALVSGS